MTVRKTPTRTTTADTVKIEQVRFVHGQTATACLWETATELHGEVGSDNYDDQDATVIGTKTKTKMRRSQWP